MRLPPALRAFLATSALCTLLCLGTEAVCRFLLHWGAPYDYPGVHSWISFNDFHGFFPKFAFFHSRAFFSAWAVLPYPAPAVAAYKLFLIPQPTPRHGGGALARFLGSMLLTAAILLWGLRRALVRRGVLPRSATAFVAGVVAFSFAFWFEFAQGNIEWMVWALMMVGIWAFCRRRFWLAAVCIGLAGSMKIFPIIFLGLFLPVRRLRAVALALLSAAVATVVSLWLLCPDIPFSWVQTIAGLGSFEHKYMVHLRPVEVGFDHSLFALVKLALGLGAGSSHSQAGLGLYLTIAALGGCVLFLPGSAVFRWPIRCSA